MERRRQQDVQSRRGQVPAKPSQQPVTASTSRSAERPRRMTAEAALVVLQNILEEQSGSESDDGDSVSSSETRYALNSDESDDENDSSKDEFSDNESNNDSASDQAGEESDDNVVTSREGTKWKILLPETELPGRVQQQNVFTAKSGTTPYCRLVTTPLEAFKLLIDDGLLRHVKACTLEFAHITDAAWDISEQELDAFIGILFLRGVMNAKNFPMKLLWSDMYGCQAFRKAMTRNRFTDIKRYLRFDVRSTRRTRIENDKFALMSWVLSRFVDNCQKSYVPEESLTIDEQLFPTKARCKFTQYMPNKPDKFGIKFWVLADLKTKYCLNIKPYLGKDEQRTSSLGTHVVMSLMEPYLGRGYNVTTDNFFTNQDLAVKLLNKRTSIVGTVRLNRKEIPVAARLPLHASIFYSSGSVNMVRYQAKANKTVVVMSTLHRGSVCQIDGKKKPESVLYYNANKCGVDMLDSMCRQMSTKAGCRRWTLAVFCNILDLAGVNAWIIFKKVTGSNIQRRPFLHKLAEQLLADAIAARSNDEPPVDVAPGKLGKRVNCQVKAKCKRNRTATVCVTCRLPVCGSCMANICTKCNP